MEITWCSKCLTDVSFAHAVAELPCPKCGATSFFVIADDGKRDLLLSESERMMRIGRWAEAENVLRECMSLELISAPDFNLSLANIEWRKQCAVSAVAYLEEASAPVALPALRTRLAREFDEYVVDWMLREFRGIRLVPDGGSYLVEVCHGEQEA